MDELVYAGVEVIKTVGRGIPRHHCKSCLECYASLANLTHLRMELVIDIGFRPGTGQRKIISSDHF